MHQRLVKIPAPSFFMFYNGTSDLEDTVTYRLSELFQHPVDDPDFLETLFYEFSKAQKK